MKVSLMDINDKDYSLIARRVVIMMMPVNAGFLWWIPILAHWVTTTAVLWPFFLDHPGEPVPEENFWTLWCKGRLTEADTQTIRLGATPSALTSAYLHHPTISFYGRMPFLPPSQQCQSTEGKDAVSKGHKKLVFVSLACSSLPVIIQLTIMLL